MKLIVGLGNPGDRYEKTRHNLGFMIVERFLKDFESVEKTVWNDQKKMKSSVFQMEWQRKHGQTEKVILAKPKTYMNNSGMSVELLAAYYKMQSSDIWVVHDDIDLPLGSIRIRFAGASAGHHGIDSIIKSLGTDKFWRFRMGIGRKNQKSTIKNQRVKNVEDFVLSKFTAQEWGKVRELIKRGSKAIQEALENGPNYAMNRFNTK
ncbi:MAG: aminoacyl-tRNA hydrolase [Patescibacteria group bacterium]|nr:aminoacyl-tRNA hydrolase [Patescibacteria group bacterium]